ncbi:MAG: hypothetical protein WBK91_03270 [Alphaproteobacteria bacterium]
MPYKRRLGEKLKSYTVISMLPTQLAYIVAEVTEEAQRCIREIRTCGNMIKLFESILSSPANLATPATVEMTDPLDRMIESLCGRSGLAEQPNLTEVLGKETNLYRLRIVKSRQRIQKIVYGRTPEERLQTLLHEMTALARSADMHRGMDHMILLHRLIRTVDDIRTTLSDFFGKQFNLDDAVTVRNTLCQKLLQNPEAQKTLGQRIALSGHQEDRELMTLAAGGVIAVRLSGEMPTGHAQF